MSAIEFVKEHGINNAKTHLSNMLSVQIDDYIQDHINDLKQIVNAWELIESLGGMDMAKDIFDIEINEPHYNYDAVKVTRIEKAINLVERCQ